MDARIVANDGDCMSANPIDGQQAVWPTTGFGNLVLTLALDNGPIQYGVRAGTKSLAMFGCFAYRTYGVAHHTA